jgi:hypothetical protein
MTHYKQTKTQIVLSHPKIILCNVPKIANLEWYYIIDFHEKLDGSQVLHAIDAALV